jgi:hypothetical protein
MKDNFLKLGILGGRDVPFGMTFITWEFKKIEVGEQGCSI